MSNKTYDLMKKMVIGVLPKTATLYIVLASIWNLPFSNEISKTIIGLATFLGEILIISNKRYKRKIEEVEE